MAALGFPSPLQRSSAHKLVPNGIGHLGPPILEALDISLQFSNTFLLDFPCEHLARLVGHANPLELVVVFQEESEVLEGNVVLGVTAVLALQLCGVLATGEGVFVDLVLDAVWRVTHEDGRGVHAGRHLGAGTLQGGKENRVDQSGFLVLHLLCVLATLPEVRVLVDSARNQTGDRRNLLPVGTKNMRETGRKGSSRLSGAKMELPDIVAVIESKGPSYGVDCDPLGHPAHVFVKSAADKVEIAEDECFLRVKSNRDNIQGIGLCISLGIIDLDLLRVHEFLWHVRTSSSLLHVRVGGRADLIVCQHNHQRTVKHILQPPWYNSN